MALPHDSAAGARKPGSPTVRMAARLTSKRISSAGGSSMDQTRSTVTMRCPYFGVRTRESICVTETELLPAVSILGSEVFEKHVEEGSDELRAT